MRLIVIKLYTMYNFLKIKNNSKLLNSYLFSFIFGRTQCTCFKIFKAHKGEFKEKEKPTYQFSFKVSEN